VIITLDTTRADHVGAYGCTLGLTPQLDVLAAQGVVFEQAYAPMCQTLPSHSTLFTGLGPRQHLALENTYKLAPEFRTLAEEATDRGYSTGAFVGALVLDRETGIDQGFQTFDLPAGVWNQEREGHPPQRRAEEVTGAALAWAQTLDPSRPYMLWAHYYDPHGDSAKGFDPPARHLAAVPRDGVRAQLEASGAKLAGAPLSPAQLENFWAGYAAEIRYTDEQVGLLLQGLRDRGLLADTLIVVVGDHGEGLYEHRIKAHGQYVWEELHRVPLIVVHPQGEAAGRRVASRVILQDVEPTVRALAFGESVRSPALGFGLDLWEGVSGKLPDRPVFLERAHFDADRVQRRVDGVDLDAPYGFLTAVLQGNHKLILHPDGSRRLFDLAADPSELHDVAAEQPELADGLQRLLEGWQAENKTALPGENVEISAEKRAALEALGYIGGDH